MNPAIAWYLIIGEVWVLFGLIDPDNMLGAIKKAERRYGRNITSTFAFAAVIINVLLWPLMLSKRTWP